MKKIDKLGRATLFIMAAITLAACGGGSDSSSTENTNTETTPKSLNQAAYDGGTAYDFGFNSVPNIPFINAPEDTDFTRYAMLHDGTTYRLYFFKQNSDDTIYQFAYNSSTQQYEYGFNSIPELNLTGMPEDADTSSFAMLHDGTTYRLYLKRTGNATTIYQFSYNSATQNYEYALNSIPILFITLAPADANLDRWAMLHDGSVYRLYTGKSGEPDTLYQFSFNAASSDYEWGFNSISELQVTNMPADSIKPNFTMLHDGSDYRFYYPSEK